MTTVVSITWNYKDGNSGAVLASDTLGTRSYIRKEVRKLYVSENGHLGVGLAGESSKNTIEHIENLVQPKHGKGIDVNRWLKRGHLTEEEKEYLAGGKNRGNFLIYDESKALIVNFDGKKYNSNVVDWKGKVYKLKDTKINEPLSRIFGRISLGNLNLENCTGPVEDRHMPDKILSIGSGSNYALLLLKEYFENEAKINETNALEAAYNAIICACDLDFYSSGEPDLISLTSDNKNSRVLNRVNKDLPDFLLL